jgi:hypothetical protein
MMVIISMEMAEVQLELLKQVLLDLEDLPLRGTLALRFVEMAKTMARMNEMMGT